MGARITVPSLPSPASSMRKKGKDLTDLSARVQCRDASILLFTVLVTNLSAKFPSLITHLILISCTLSLAIFGVVMLDFMYFHDFRHCSWDMFLLQDQIEAQKQTKSAFLNKGGFLIT